MRALLLTLLFALALPGAAEAARIYGVTPTKVVSFDHRTPETVATVPLTGPDLTVEVPIGLDARVGGNELVLLTRSVQTGQGKLWRLNPVTGLADTPRGLLAEAGDPYVSLPNKNNTSPSESCTSASMSDICNSASTGMDVDPTSARLRVVNRQGENLSVHLDGSVDTQTPIDMPEREGDANAPENAEMSANAFSNNVPGASTTTLFDYHYNSDRLYIQSPPDSGAVQFVGTNPLSASDGAQRMHMDVGADGAGFATSNNRDDGQVLWQLDPATAAGSLLGKIGGTDDDLRGMTVSPANLVSLRTPTVRVPEGGEATLTLERRNIVGAAEITWATSQGTAQGGDFPARSETVAFADREATKTISVPTTDDTAVEDDEAFTVSLGTKIGTDASVLQPQVATVTVTSDDVAPERPVGAQGLPGGQVGGEANRNAGPSGGTALKPGRCANAQSGTFRGDKLLGTRAGDLLDGLSGRDRLDGGAGDDCLDGGDGDDALLGQAGADTLTGGRNRDALDGGAGNDVMDGGPGNDVITGGAGLNQVRAGTGDDRILVRNRKRDVVDCGKGRDRVTADRIDRLKGCERVSRR